MNVIPLMLLLLVGCSDGSEVGGMPGSDPGPAESVRLERVATGLDNPLFLTSPPGDARLFVVEQPGRIRIIQNGQLLDTPFLDLTGRISSGGERGLLGLAFHPDYARNGRFFVNYTDPNGDTRIVRFRASADPNRADAASATPILAIPQPFSNHNGGMTAFGPDGKLYIGMGDGGSGGDPQGNGQNLGTLLGAMLRIDVDGAAPYSIPADNPLVGTPGARPEIWAYGLRNPWRFSWDRDTGTLFTADVGQNRWEEINAVPARAAGLNYGWNRLEGTHCFRDESCERAGTTLPVIEYNHDDGCSVTGGYVYRGRQVPSIQGQYFYADFCGGWVHSVRVDGTSVSAAREWEFGDIGRILSFGEDAAGELYVLSSNGSVYRLMAAN